MPRQPPKERRAFYYSYRSMKNGLYISITVKSILLAICFWIASLKAISADGNLVFELIPLMAQASDFLDNQLLTTNYPSEVNEKPAFDRIDYLYDSMKKLFRNVERLSDQEQIVERYSNLYVMIEGLSSVATSIIPEQNDEILKLNVEKTGARKRLIRIVREINRLSQIDRSESNDFRIDTEFPKQIKYKNFYIDDIIISGEFRDFSTTFRDILSNKEKLPSLDVNTLKILTARFDVQIKSDNPLYFFEKDINSKVFDKRTNSSYLSLDPFIDKLSITFEKDIVVSDLESFFIICLNLESERISKKLLKDFLQIFFYYKKLLVLIRMPIPWHLEKRKGKTNLNQTSMN